jgi:hypothetical protein
MSEAGERKGGREEEKGERDGENDGGARGRAVIKKQRTRREREE